MGRVESRYHPALPHQTGHMAGTVIDPQAGFDFDDDARRRPFGT